jgi:membrane protease YdiL (CAAX protease family)
MDTVVMVLGFVAEVIAWSLVARGRNVWTTMTPVLATMGMVALVVGPIAWSPEVAPGASLAVGLGLGLLLYVATRGAMVIMARWGTFRRHALEMYRKQGGLSLGAALLLSIALSVPGEELFWRGFFQGQLASSLEGRTAVAAVLAWIAFVLANLPSANLAIAAGALVGGAVWVALAWWTGGVLASLACHIVWTGMMVAFPVLRAPAETTT